MRYSAIIKFFAFVLCAAVIVTAVGSGAGLLALTECGLYNRTLTDFYNEDMDYKTEYLARQVAARYASLSLGGASQQLVNDYYPVSYGFFEADRVGYELKDADGTVLQTQGLSSGQQSFITQAEGSYIKVLKTEAVEETAPAPSEPAEILIHAMPSGDTEISNVTLHFADGSLEQHDLLEYGYLEVSGDRVILTVEDFDSPGLNEDKWLEFVTLLDADRRIVYEAYGANGLLLGYTRRDDVSVLVFPGEGVQEPAPEELLPEELLPEDTYPVQETIPDTIPPDETPVLRGVVLRDTEVYSMPSQGGKTDIWLKAGTEVTVLQREAIGDASWARIDLGWISMADLVLEQTAEAEAAPVAEEPEATAAESVQAVAVGDAAVYSTPDGEKPVGELKKGDTVTVLKQEAYLGEIWGLTEAGWVRMGSLDVLAPTPVALETETGQASWRAISGVTATVPLEETASEETIPEETAPVETVPEEIQPEAGALAQEDPLALYDPEEIRTYTYYDQSQGQAFDVWYVMEPLPAYTLELHLAPGADRSEMLWMLLELAYFLKDWLLMILGGSLALLALCTVYLCCAAAHKRGSDVIRAGALNRLPLDGYVTLVALALTALVALGYEGTEYFLQNGLREFGFGVLSGSAYACALLLVGFAFAFVAQIKTPGGFWWRNSICGRCVLLVVRLCRRTVVFCGSQGWSLLRSTLRWLKRMGTALLRFGAQAARWGWNTGKALCLWSWELVCRFFRWLRGNLARGFGLLPITWQFLATGFALVFFLYIMIRTYKVGYILMGFGIFFAVILYAASAFAILLESAKRMSKGDLDTKVDDRLLIGGFREFAQRLNDLAGVAVIAAQKQLKSERMKTELITNVSHDIKTPLTSIINYVDLLQKPHTQEQQKQYLEVLERQSQRLKKLIDDLMEMSKASTGNLAVDISTVDAGEAVNQALGEFADKLERAQLTPVFRQPEEPVYMLADGRLVWRVMSNLLGNAVKYALPGTRIYVDLMALEGKVIISMKNISREELNVNADELMERFVRGDASRNTEGSGLGLNIAQSLMELQRGQLQILVDGDLFKVTMIFPGA